MAPLRAATAAALRHVAASGRWLPGSEPCQPPHCYCYNQPPRSVATLRQATDIAIVPRAPHIWQSIERQVLKPHSSSSSSSSSPSLHLPLQQQQQQPSRTYRSHSSSPRHYGSAAAQRVRQQPPSLPFGWTSQLPDKALPDPAPYDELEVDDELLDEADDPDEEVIRRKIASTSSTSKPKSSKHSKAAAAASSVQSPKLRTKKAGVDTEQADISDVTVVQDKASAERVLQLLNSVGIRSRYHAIDTEVTDLDVKEQSPIGNGKVTCFSIYVGHDVDFGSGPRLYVNTLDTTDSCDMFEVFKSYLEDASIKKIFHNFSFDRAVFYNHGVDVRGLAGDTMHMARLWNASRKQQGGYGLDDLSFELLGPQYAKRTMKERFSRARLKKDGTESKIYEIPPVHEIQRSPDFHNNWIDYATFDTQATFLVREQLELKLRQMPWSTQSNGNGSKKDATMFDFYQRYYVPFGEVLTEMERVGFYIRQDYLPVVQKQAEDERDVNIQKFRDWSVKQIGDVALKMNIGSSAQKQQLFYGAVGSTREFSCENVDNVIIEGKKRATKKLKFDLPGLGLSADSKTKKGAAQTDYATLRKLAGTKLESDTPKYGAAYQHFGGGDAGRAACLAIDALCNVSQVDTMLNTFIHSLQHSTDSNHRVHCSLNLNTETGRLSSRRPNLQNQPALEKDKYKIRDAFAAAPGKKLIVADYGQLELRVLAHMTKCKSMIEAFKLGGDFHSRTALGMYDQIKQAVNTGACLLEWDEKEHGGQKAPVPLIKDMFYSQRQKAKILNFSIAYGKTAHGLSIDFNVSKSEALETVDRWYADRPEVKAWQQQQIDIAKEHGWTRTLMGRYRPLPDILHSNAGVRGHNERAAINTPIQGGAADIVMMAMIKLHEHQRLRELGWKIILQVHDEIIAEGPQESTDEAMSIVRHCMENPFKNPLLVDLTVDAKADYTWYKAK